MKCVEPLAQGFVAGAASRFPIRWSSRVKISATSLAQVSQYFRSPHLSTIRANMAPGGRSIGANGNSASAGIPFPSPLKMMRRVGASLRSILLISASNRSSCERKRAQDVPDHAETFVVVQRRGGVDARRHRDRQDDVAVLLAGALRMARPTAWTMSTCEFRGLMNSTASSAGTSMPSERQRAFERMRHVPSALPFSHSIRALRSSA